MAQGGAINMVAGDIFWHPPNPAIYLVIEQRTFLTVNLLNQKYLSFQSVRTENYNNNLERNSYIRTKIYFDRNIKLGKKSIKSIMLKMSNALYELTNLGNVQTIIIHIISYMCWMFIYYAMVSFFCVHFWGEPLFVAKSGWGVIIYWWKWLVSIFQMMKTN